MEQYDETSVDCHKTFLSPSEAYRATPTAGSIGLSHGRRAITRQVSAYPARQRASMVAGGEVVFPRIVLVVEPLGIHSSRCMVVAHP